MISVFVADSQFLVAQGILTLLEGMGDVQIAGLASDRKSVMNLLPRLQPDVLIIDFTSEACTLKDLAILFPFLPTTKILALTPHLEKRHIQSALDAGVISYVLKDCGKEEIEDAVRATSKGEKFFCGKVVDTLMAELGDAMTTYSSAACEALNLSEREMEIIRLIAEGNSNKQIAEQLFLSQHTINTHRKNIMSKLGVNNTAGIVLFAVKEHLVSPNKYLFG